MDNSTEERDNTFYKINPIDLLHDYKKQIIECMKDRVDKWLFDESLWITFDYDSNPDYILINVVNLGIPIMPLKHRRL